MNRSKRCVFLSHCLMAQAVRAEGLAKYEPAAIKKVIQFFLDNDINMMQMPCPEFRCTSGGPGRKPHGKKWYEANGLRELSQSIAVDQVSYMETLIANGFEVLAIVGVEFSPACAPTYLNKGRSIQRDQGIYVEELKKELKARSMDIKFIGIHPAWTKKMEASLNELIKDDPMGLFKNEGAES